MMHKHIKSIFLALALVSSLFFDDAIGNNKGDMDVLTLKISLPKLPKGWRLPTDEELSHVMRPQYPDYIDSAELDGDRGLDIAILAVNEAESIQGLLVFMSSLNKWLVLETNSFDSKKIYMTLMIQGCNPAVISYGSLGGVGYKYYWDPKKRGFESEIEGE